MSLVQTQSQLPYQIVRKIGEGSAIVYQARTNGIGLPGIVAVKATTPGRALQEARILASLDHPGIPRFYGLIEDDIQSFVIMDYIEGETLAQYLKSFLDRGTLPPQKQVLRIGMQLSEILNYLHTRSLPITFHDVKPENVMLTPDGRLYLIDFDIACMHTGMENNDFFISGTPDYMAPEQMLGMSFTSPRSDIYSLGATLYYLLTGHHCTMNRRETAQNRAFMRLPLSLRHLLLWMTAPDPQDRPTDMRIVGEALRQAFLVDREAGSSQFAQVIHHLEVELHR
jgi:serine/threonine protein kinase